MEKLDKLFVSALRATTKKRLSSGGKRPVGQERTAIMKTARRSARSKLAHSRKATDKTNLNELAEMLGLRTVDDYQDRIMNNSNDTWSYVHKEALSEGLSEEEAEEKAQQAEQEENDEAIGKHIDAVTEVAENLLEKHGLTLAPIMYRGKPSKFDFKIAPQKSWSDAAAKLMETINGVGYFHFSNLKEFLDSGPYSVRDASLKHVHWIKDYGEVYGDGSPKGDYDRKMRH